MNTVIQIGQYSIGIVDLVIFAICMISAVVSCIRGFVTEFSHLGGLIAGFLVGIMFTSTLTVRLAEVITVDLPLWVLALMAFVILTLIGYLVISFHLGAIDNILGFFWGLLSALFFLSVITYVLSLQTVFDLSRLFSSSVFITRVIEPMLPETISALESVLVL